MNIVMTIDAIEELINSLKSQNKIEKLQTYSAIQTLIKELEKYTEEEKAKGNTIPNVSIYLTELLTPLQCLSGLEVTGHSDEQNLSWLIAGLLNLRSYHCFDVYPSEQKQTSPK